MQIVIAQMSHETNTFSPVPTPLARFSRFSQGLSTPLEGKDAYAAFKGTGSCMGGFIQVCEDIGAEIRIPVAAAAPPADRLKTKPSSTWRKKSLLRSPGDVTDSCWICTVPW